MIAVIFTSTFPPKKIEAAATTIAVGGAAVSATAIYVLGAMAVGGLATAVGVEYGDEINAHAKNVWDTASTTVKTGFTTALAAAENGYVNLTGATKTWFDSATKTITNKLFLNKSTTLSNSWSQSNVTDLVTFSTNSSTVKLYEKTFTLPAGHYLALNTDGGLFLSETFKVSLARNGYFFVSSSTPSKMLLSGNMRDIYGLDFANALLHSLANVTNYQMLTNVLNNNLGTGFAVVSDSTLTSYYNSILSVGNVFGTGALGLKLPSDNLYLPQTSDGQTLTKNPDGTYSYPGGEIYAGDLGYTLPNLKTLDLDGVRIPALPLLDFPGHYVNVNTGQIIKTLETDIPGDVPFPPAEVVPEPTQTEVGGLFAKLWDWLKKILDGILGLPAKLIALLTTLLSTLFVPSETFWLENFNELKLLFAEKLDTDSYLSVLDSIKNVTSPSFSDVKLPSIMGSGETIIIKASYINSALPTIHNWVKGLFFVLLVFYNLNNVYKLLRGGDITSAIDRRERRDKN